MLEGLIVLDNDYLAIGVFKGRLVQNINPALCSFNASLQMKSLAFRSSHSVFKSAIKMFHRIENEISQHHPTISC